MKLNKFYFAQFALLFVLLFLRLPVYGEDQPPEDMKFMCDKMIRYGIEAHERKKYLHAKEYFRNAIQYDPKSELAWKYYDIAVIYGLAERVRTYSNLIKPEILKDVTDSSQQPPSENSNSDSDYEFKIIEEEGDEGCY